MSKRIFCSICGTRLPHEEHAKDVGLGAIAAAHLGFALEGQVRYDPMTGEPLGDSAGGQNAKLVTWLREQYGAAVGAKAPYYHDGATEQYMAGYWSGRANACCEALQHVDLDVERPT